MYILIYIYLHKDALSKKNALHVTNFIYSFIYAVATKKMFDKVTSLHVHSIVPNTTSSDADAEDDNTKLSILNQKVNECHCI